MWDRRIVGWLLALTVPAGGGCQSLFRYRPVTVLVRDAETKQPIPGADVHLSYPMGRDSLAPYDATGVTDGDGTVHLRAAPYGDAGILIEGSAKGYVPEGLSVSSEDIARIQPTPLIGPDPPRPVHFIVEMYTEPRVTVELILPPNYRGLVKATVDARDDFPGKPGQRCFRYRVPASGEVHIVGPALLRRVESGDYRARYEEGPLLPQQPGDAEVGLRWFKGEKTELYFVAGNRREYEWAHRFSSQAEDEPIPRSSSSGGGGSGRGRRHGGGGTGDSR